MGFQDIEQLFQELAFEDGLDAATTLFWYNVITLPAYLLVIPLESVKYLNGKTEWVSVDEVFENQWHAFCCAIGYPYYKDTIGDLPKLFAIFLGFGPIYLLLDMQECFFSMLF